MAHVQKQSDTSDSFHGCPIPKTHRRLIEAHVLWHQALAQYHQPDLFHANLNATIQALRNITFVLQNEKHAFRDFDGWYGPWQERMKANPILMWLKDARNTVVKQGELEIKSTAVVKLITWRDHVLMESSVPPMLPPSLMLRNIPVFELVNNIQIPPGDVKSAALVIERCWRTPDLEGWEIMEALAEAYGALSDVVLDAHTVLSEFTCISNEKDHSHFRSTYDRTSTISCMGFGDEDRTHRFELATGKELEAVSLRASAPKAATETAAARYGFEKIAKIPKWQEADPMVVAERVQHAAKRILRKDKYHRRMIFIRDGRGVWHIAALDASNRTEKHLLMRMVARFIESVGGDALIDVGEAWQLPAEESARVIDRDRIGEIPGRKEALHVLVAMREGVIRVYSTPFKRGPFGGIKLGDTVEFEEGYPYYLSPVLDVWRRQGTVDLADGRRLRRLWEPDPLDICCCGGPKRFTECCKPLLNSPTQPLAVEKRDIDSARANGDFERAEKLSRAALAQYVIWVRQHTTPTMHVAPDLHKELVGFDIPTMNSLVGQLHEALKANGHLDSFLPQIHHVSRLVGLPALSLRLTALAAQSLLESGDYMAAVEELKSLGDVERLEDSLALILVTKVFDWPAHKQTQYLNRAVSNAYTDDERIFAELELIDHLAGCGERDEALRTVDSLIAKTKDAERNSNAFADSLVLRWRITKNDEDFQAAKNELESYTNSERQRELAILLIDHGDFAKAESQLAQALITGDPVAQLIIVDARLRAGRADIARELLLSIVPERVTAHLRYPFAVASAFVALASNDEDLKKLATARLVQVTAIDAQGRKHVSDLLDLLRNREATDKESIVARFRGLFTR